MTTDNLRTDSGHDADTVSEPTTNPSGSVRDATHPANPREPSRELPEMCDMMTEANARVARAKLHFNTVASCYLARLTVSPADVEAALAELNDAQFQLRTVTATKGKP